MTRVLVTGGSGRLGRATLETLTKEGYETRATSRSARDSEAGGVRWFGADLATGRGLEEAVAGADVVVHLASAPYRGRYTRRVELDGTGALLAAARAAGVRHLVYLSIVGADQVPWGYFRVKVQAERLVRDGGVPWTVLRARSSTSSWSRRCAAWPGSGRWWPIPGYGRSRWTSGTWPGG